MLSCFKNTSLSFLSYFDWFIKTKKNITWIIFLRALDKKLSMLMLLVHFPLLNILLTYSKYKSRNNFFTSIFYFLIWSRSYRIVKQKFILSRCFPASYAKIKNLKFKLYLTIIFLIF